MFDTASHDSLKYAHTMHHTPGPCQTLCCSPAAAHVSLKLLLNNLRGSHIQEGARGKARQGQVHKGVDIAHKNARKDGTGRHKGEGADTQGDLQQHSAAQHSTAHSSMS